MPKVRGPLFSAGASGSILKTITYAKHTLCNRVIAKTFRKEQQATHGNLATGWFKKGWIVWKNQAAVFNYFISNYCNGLITSQQDKWKRKSFAHQLNGIAYFQKLWIKRSLKGLPQFQLPPRTGFCLCGEWVCGKLTCGGKHELGG